MKCDPEIAKLVWPFWLSVGLDLSKPHNQVWMKKKKEKKQIITEIISYAKIIVFWYPDNIYKL